MSFYDRDSSKRKHRSSGEFLRSTLVGGLLAKRQSSRHRRITAGEDKAHANGTAERPGFGDHAWSAHSGEGDHAVRRMATT
jgi:hypothetical protein